MNKIALSRFTEENERGFDILTNIQLNSKLAGSKTIYPPLAKPRRNCWSRAIALAHTETGPPGALAKLHSTPDLNGSVTPQPAEEEQAYYIVSGSRGEAREGAEEKDRLSRIEELSKEAFFAVAKHRRSKRLRKAPSELFRTQQLEPGSLRKHDALFDAGTPPRSGPSKKDSEQAATPSPDKLYSTSHKASGSFGLQRRSLADLKPIQKVLPLVESGRASDAGAAHGQPEKRSSKAAKSPGPLGRPIRTGAFQVLNSARAVAEGSN